MDEPKPGDKELLEKIDMQTMVGEFDQALATLTSFNKHYPYRMETRPLYKHIMNQKRIMDQVIQYLNLKSYSKALKKLRQLSPEFPNCDRIRLLMIECLIHIQGLTDDAEIYFDQVSNAEYLYVDQFQNKCLKLYVRSLINFYNCDFKASMDLLEELFSLDKCHVRGIELQRKLLEVLSAFEKVDYYVTKEDWKECINCLTQAMELEPSNKALTRDILVAKATAYAKMFKIKDAEKIVAQLLAMGINPKNIQLQTIREEIHYAKTVGQVNDVNMNPNFKNLKLPDYQLTFISEDFQKLLATVEQMNMYQILGLDSTSQLTQALVEQASRQLIKRYHPDNFASNPEIHGCCVEIFQHIKRAEKYFLVELNRLKSTIN